MKQMLLILTALLLVPLAALHAADAPKPKPNVLLIIADDQGYADFGFMGNRLVKTPCLDRLAGQSAVFENRHLTLRGPCFKYHALPGGKAAFFDLDADPGETTDVQAKFPKVAAKMAQECRKRWDEILASGRAFAPQTAALPAASKEARSSSGNYGSSPSHETRPNEGCPHTSHRPAGAAGRAARQASLAGSSMVWETPRWLFPATGKPRCDDFQ